MKTAPFDRIYSLGEERVAEIKERLRLGQSPMSIVRRAQDEWGVWPDLNPKSIEKQLLRFRRRVVLRESSAMPAPTLRGDVKAAVRQIDVIKELTWLVEVQTGRVQKLLGQEGQMPLLVGMATKEIEALRVVLKTFAEVALETGAIPRAPKVVTAAVEMAFDERNAPPGWFRWSDDSERLYQQIVERYGEPPGDRSKLN